MTEKLSNDRSAALLVFIPALLSLAIVLHHPVLRHVDRQDSAALAAGIGRIALPNAVFHGVILMLSSIQALGLFGFAERLGLSRCWVRAGVMLYGLATILIFVPGTLDGFVTPLLGVRCAVDPTSCSSLTGSIAFEWAAIQGFTKVALGLQALGLLSWSVALILMGGRPRRAGVAGALIASAPLVLLGTMTHAIDPLRLAEIIVFEAVWATAAATLLWLRMLPDPH